MSVIDLMKERYSCRCFLERQVEPEKLEAVLNAGRIAPTAVNYQPQRVYVIQSDEGLAKIRQATRMAFNAPVVLMFCYDDRVVWNNKRDPGYNSGEMDVSIVATHMMLAATELGLQTLWARGYATKDIVEAFNLPEHMHLVCIMPIGYPDPEKGKPSPKHFDRQSLEEQVTYL